MPKPRPTPTGLFQSTHPVRGATATCRHTPEMHAISIHAPREGCDPPARTTVPVFHVFQSTHPVRGATHVHSVGVATCEIFQSTHPVRGATTFCHSLSPCGYISIHAPREGCDVLVIHAGVRIGISIHAPREGCDRENGLRIPRYGHSDHSLASIVLYNPLASPQIRKSAESKYQQIIHS